MKTFSRPFSDGRIFVQAHRGVIHAALVGCQGGTRDSFESAVSVLCDWLGSGASGAVPSPWVRGW